MNTTTTPEERPGKSKTLTTHGMAADKKSIAPAARERRPIITTRDLNNAGKLTDVGRARIEGNESEANRSGPRRAQRDYPRRIIGLKQ